MLERDPRWAVPAAAAVLDPQLGPCTGVATQGQGGPKDAASRGSLKLEKTSPSGPSLHTPFPGTVLPLCAPHNSSQCFMNFLFLEVAFSSLVLRKIRELN